jgi:predicted nucleic acid-binding protein
MKVVVDASVACKWFIEETGSGAARALLSDETADLLAPEWIVAEVYNTAWKKVRRREIGREQCTSIAIGLPMVVTELIATRSLAARALEIALELDHPVYDCIYLALAEREDTHVVTADDRLKTRLDATRSPWARRVRLLEAVSA